MCAGEKRKLVNCTGDYSNRLSDAGYNTILSNGDYSNRLYDTGSHLEHSDGNSTIQLSGFYLAHSVFVQ